MCVCVCVLLWLQTYVDIGRSVSLHSVDDEVLIRLWEYLWGWRKSKEEKWLGEDCEVHAEKQDFKNILYTLYKNPSSRRQKKKKKP